MKAKLFFLDVIATESLPKDLSTLNPNHNWKHEDIRNLLLSIDKNIAPPYFCQLLLGPESCNSTLEVILCCCRTFPALIVIIKAISAVLFGVLYNILYKLLKIFQWYYHGRCYYFEQGEWLYKGWLSCKLCKLWQACSAYPFPDIYSICSSKLFQNGVIFLQEKAKNVLFHVPLLFFCTQLYKQLAWIVIIQIATCRARNWYLFYSSK